MSMEAYADCFCAVLSADAQASEYSISLTATANLQAFRNVIFILKKTKRRSFYAFCYFEFNL
ncbi:MAG: hypothetical protein C0507_25420 [Cyanobacteria bacterium PR.3.49]|nr:hypothetical protein [Cyanobacteria bacterium PR.3.49]